MDKKLTNTQLVDEIFGKRLVAVNTAHPSKANEPPTIALARAAASLGCGKFPLFVLIEAVKINSSLCLNIMLKS